MTDRCETCGWMKPAVKRDDELAGSPPMCMFDVQSVPVSEDHGCSNHTAVQRRRDRLMLAGQALAGFLASNSTGNLVAASFARADEMLERADA